MSTAAAHSHFRIFHFWKEKQSLSVEKHASISIVAADQSALMTWTPKTFIFCERHLHITLNFIPFSYYCTRSEELQEKFGQVLKFAARLPGHLFNSGISVHLELQGHFLTTSPLTWQQQHTCKTSWLKKSTKSLSWAFTLLEKLSTAGASILPHTYKPMSSPWKKWNFQERQRFSYMLLLALLIPGNGDGAWQIAIQINYLGALTCHLAGLCVFLLP